MGRSRKASIDRPKFVSCGAFLVDGAPGRSDSDLRIPICFDAFRQTIRNQRSERCISDATMPPAKTPPAAHPIGATLIEEAENRVSRRRYGGGLHSACQNRGALFARRHLILRSTNSWRKAAGNTKHIYHLFLRQNICIDFLDRVQLLAPR